MSEVKYKKAKVSVAEIPIELHDTLTGKVQKATITGLLTDHYEHPITGAKSVRVLVENGPVSKVYPKGYFNHLLSKSPLLAYDPETKGKATKFNMFSKPIKIRTVSVKIQDRDYGPVPEGSRQAMAALTAGELHITAIKNVEAPAV